MRSASPRPHRKSARTFASALLALALVAWSPITLRAETGSAQIGGAGSTAREATVVIPVRGMTCGSCAEQVQNALNQMTGVKSAEVSFQKGQAVVTFDSSATCRETLQSAIISLGYKVEQVEAKGTERPGVGSAELPGLEVARLREEFNRASDQVRLLAILSPTCGPCQKGRGVVGEVFEKQKSGSLRGFVVWLPMKPADSAWTAWSESEKLQDQRISVRGWDGGHQISDLFGKSLKLKGTAWDVYLLYAPGVKWQKDAPPEPTFWMHQLRDEGADQSLCLNPAALEKRADQLLEQAR